MKHLRSIVTFAAIAVPGVLVATTTFLTPLTPGTLDRSPEQVRMPTADTRVICPGPLLVDSAAEGTDAQFVDDSNVSTRVVSATAPISAVDGSVSAAGLRVANLGEAPRFDNPVSGGFVSGDDEVDRTTIVTGFARPGAPALSSAVETIEGTSGDLTGLATLTCSPAASRLSVVAGSGQVGSNSQLLLSNPGDVAVQASITVLTPSGVRTEPTQLSIRAGSQRGVRLGGLAPGADALAVDVTVDGGVLSGSVQETRLSGLTPKGIDLASGGAKAAKQQVITGLNGERVRLRVAAPGRDPAEVGIRAFGSSGEISLPRSRMTVVAHGVAEVDLGDLEGASLILDSSEDIAASASVSKDLDKGAVDFASIPATGSLGDSQILVLPRVGTGTLYLSPGQGRVEVRGMLDDGALTDAVGVDLNPTGTTALSPAELSPSAVRAVVLDAGNAQGSQSDGVHASVLVDAPTGVSAVAPAPAPAGVAYRDVRLR